MPKSLISSTIKFLIKGVEATLGPLSFGFVGVVEVAAVEVVADMVAV